MSEAMSKAWSHIERESGSASKQVKDDMKDMSGQANETADSIKGRFFKSFTDIAKKAATAFVSIFAVKKLIDFGSACIDLGSDLQEVQNVVDVTFPKMTEKVNEFAREAAASFGLSETMAKKFTGTFGAMAKAYGFSEEAAYDMSTTLTGLAGDVASFYNISQDEAYTKLKPVFTGETESLKDLGIVMTQTALDSYALANGFGKTTAKMTEAEKVALRYQFVQEQLTGAAGDFMRTSDGWANQVRVLNLQFESLKATIGQGLINLFTPILKIVNTLISKLITLANGFKALTEMFSGKKGGDAAGQMEAATEAAEKASAATEGIGDAAAASAKKMKGLFTFDDMNVEGKDSDQEGSTGGGAAFDFGVIDAGAVKETESGLDRILGKSRELCELFRQGFQIGFGDSGKKAGVVLENIREIGSTLRSTFEDQGIREAAAGMFDAVAEGAGKITGSFARIGLTAAENLTGGIRQYLENSQGYIKERIISLFDVAGGIAEKAGELAAAFGEIFDIFGGESARDCTEHLIGIFSDKFLGIVDLAGRFGQDIFRCIADPIINNKDKIGEALENTLAPLSGILTALHDAVKNTFQKIFQVYEEYLKPAFDKVASGISIVFAGVMDAYNNYLAPVLGWISERFGVLMAEYIQPLIDSFLEFAGKATEALSMLWEFISPFLSWLAEVFFAQIGEKLQWLWTVVEFFVSAVSAAVQGIIDICSGILDFIVGIFTGDWEKAWNGVKEIFEGVARIIQGIMDAIGNFISNTFSAAVTKVKNILCLMKSIITSSLDAVKTVFTNTFDSIYRIVSGIISGTAKIIRDTLNLMKSIISTSLGAIKTVFTKIFDSISETVSGVFSGICNFIKNSINSILGVVESMANGIIRAINGMISALNSIHVDIPDWVPLLGGKSFGISLPLVPEINIPKLAEGGFVKANTPQLAMIGDNRHQGEIVAPEDKIYEVSARAMKDVMQSFMAALASMLNMAQGRQTTIVLKVTGEMAPFVRMLKVEMEKEAQRVGADLKVVYT